MNLLLCAAVAADDVDEQTEKKEEEEITAAKVEEKELLCVHCAWRRGIIWYCACNGNRFANNCFHFSF